MEPYKKEHTNENLCVPFFYSDSSESLTLFFFLLININYRLTLESLRDQVFVQYQ